MKIGLIGCAGCGKGFVANILSKKLNLPYLSSKDITRPILKQKGYVYSQDNYVQKFLSKKDIQFHIVDQRIYEQSLLTGGFVTDRTTLQCLSYSFLNLQSYTKEQFELLRKICLEDLKQYNYLFYFPLRGSWLQKNELRTMDINFQWKIDMIIRGLINDQELSDIIFLTQEVMKQGTMDQYIYNYIMQSLQDYENKDE